MINCLRFTILIILFSNINLFAYTVTSSLDLPDEDLEDGIYYPPTLRSAIQNANYHGIATNIIITPDKTTIRLQSNLPAIHVPMNFDGKGLLLEPHEGFLVNNGLFFTSNNSILKNVTCKNFNGSGIVWQGDDGVITNVRSLNNNGPGLNMNWADRNRIGDPNVVGYYDCFFYGAKGDGGHGVSLLWSNNNVIEKIATGIDDIQIAKPNSRHGIYLSESSGNVIRKCIISGNDWDGIDLDGDNLTNNTIIEFNIIGSNQQINDSVANKGNGISISSSKGDTIRWNNICGNWGNGIFIANNFCQNILIEHNKIGTDKSTKFPIPNGVGIRVNGSNHTVRNNIISGNRGSGLSYSMTANVISNIIGLDSNQTTEVPNGTGVSIFGSNITFGDTTNTYTNVIAGNLYEGIILIGAQQKNLKVVNTIFGSNDTYTKVFRNGGSAIKLTHSINNVEISGNYIAGSGLHGIELIRNVVIFLDPNRPHLYQKPYNIYIHDNCLGCMDYDRDNARFGGSGIWMYSVDSIYVYNNYIQGTDYDGIFIGNDSTRYVSIYGNTIGNLTPDDSSSFIWGSGISIEDADYIGIGNYDDIDYRNLIQNCYSYGISAFNSDSLFIINNDIMDIDYDGIYIENYESDFILIYQNLIGPLNSDEKLKIGRHGINIKDALNILIGNQLLPSDSNHISGCKGYGLSINGLADEIYSFANTFHDCDSGAITLNNLKEYFDNGYYNDSLDLDDGPNLLQNTADMEIGEAKGDSARIKAYFKGFADSDYRLEIFLGKKLPDNIKYKTAGEIFINSINITTDSLGNAFIDTVIKDSRIALFSAENTFVTLTASGLHGTSPFSHISYIPADFIDLKIQIDTNNSFWNKSGLIKISSKITNIGTLDATNIIVNDTTSSVFYDSVFVSSGIAEFQDSIFKAVIPALSNGDTVTFESYGFLKETGEHFRKVHVRCYNPEISINNNQDSILFIIEPSAHKLILNSGWNLVSTYIKSELSDSVRKITDDSGENITIVKNNSGAVYIPSFGIDNIGIWDITQGYLFYMNKIDTVIITGFEARPSETAIPLSAGWNMISFLSSSEMEAPTAFASITDNGNLVIAKDLSGNVYIPSFGINSIGSLIPGQGYRIYVTNIDNLVYPDN